MAKIVISGEELEVGRIIWFETQKGYGFAQVGLTNEEIFVHRGDQRMLDTNDDTTITFCDHSMPGVLQDPVRDDVILFLRAPGKGDKPKAKPWIPLEDYLTVENALNYLNSPCDCGHKMKDHTGMGECMEAGCHCGDEAYEHDDDEPREIIGPEGPMSTTFCQ